MPGTYNLNVHQTSAAATGGAKKEKKQADGLTVQAFDGRAPVLNVSAFRGVLV
jgi:hypothetical protein